MKKILSMVFLFALFASSCSQDELVKNQSTSSINKLFTASFEGNESRTYIENGNLLRWTEGDQISLFDGNTLNRQFQFDGETGDNAGTFSVVDKPYGTGNDLNANYAVYLYAKDIKITEDGIITATLPSEQSYSENSFGLGDNTMVAVTQDTDDTFLKFKNVCGYLKLQLYGDDVTIKTITLTGNNNEKLAGKATITATFGSNPSVSMTNEATETITLDCGENGVKIGTSTESATAFWVVLPPTTFEKGFTVTITDVNGGKFEKTTSKEFAIERNVIKPMASIEVKPEMVVDEIPYLTFSADAEQSLKMSKAVETLEYSVDGSDWKELGTNTIYFGGKKGVLQVRGKSSFGTAKNTGDYSQISFGNETPVACSGDIRTLLDYEHFATVYTGNAKFYRLFNYCRSLTKAPELPAKNLADYCYASMFNHCSNLTTAPELPATTLAKYCYQLMFNGCTSLVSAPNLPATTLAFYCYGSMFEGCTNLHSVPELPATSLANWCYSAMFKKCTSLTSAPKLPATILTDYCYADMFWGCNNLIQAPELPATTLAYSCYATMFSGCSNLTSAPELPATTLASDCYRYMFSDCNSLNSITMLATNISANSCLEGWTNRVASTGTFIKAKEMESLPSGSNGIPYGWTVKNYGETEEHTPYLTFKADATQTLTMSKAVETLEYSVGDSNWTKLGTTTVSFGGNLGNLRLRGKSNNGTASDPFNYSRIIFGNETAVACGGDIRTLVDYESHSTVNTSNARFCNLFQECSSLTTAPELPATNLAESCYYNMFNYCRNLTIAPDLPATTLANHCYYQMFVGCSSLTKAPQLPAIELADYCYDGMFWNCTSLTSTPQLPAKKLAKYCYSLMFNNCSSLTVASELPATELADYCYDSMFGDCTSLIKAPQIAATTLAYYCCKYMFSGCKKLAFAPELPATTLVAHCYKGMFAYCTSLTVGPKLPATTLAPYCYENMFWYCNNINSITMLATDISANSCLTEWTYGVASTGTFTKAEKMESLPSGSNGIPNGWTIKNYGEE